MNDITSNLSFPAFSGNSRDKVPSDNYDSNLKIFEEMVDHIVAKRLKDSKAEAQAALEKAKLEAERQAKIAFLRGAVLQAEAALAGVSSPPASRSIDPLGAPTPAPADDRAFKESQVLYWKAKLTEVGVPDGMGGLV